MKVLDHFGLDKGDALLMLAYFAGTFILTGGVAFFVFALIKYLFIG